jgi:hypothetical protein
MADMPNSAANLRTASVHDDATTGQRIPKPGGMAEWHSPSCRPNELTNHDVADSPDRRDLRPNAASGLASNPFSARVRGYTQPQKLTSTVLQDQQSVQQPKRDRRHQEQIHRCDAVGMIAKEGPPALRRRHPPPRHVLCDRGLSDIDAELEQFAVYPRSAPKRVCDTHLANEAANAYRYRRPATAQSRFPAPIGSEAGVAPQAKPRHGQRAVAGFGQVQMVNASSATIPNPVTSTANATGS